MQANHFCVGVAFATILWAAPAQSQVKNLDHPHVEGQLIVRFEPQLTKADAASILTTLGGKPVHGFRSSHSVLVEFPAAKSAADLLHVASKLAATDAVTHIEANQILYADDTMPNDARFGELYGLHNAGAMGGTAGADIDAPGAWDTTVGSREVLVGIIDTGVDYTHADLAANMWTNAGEVGTDANGADKTTNGIDDDGNGFIDDFRGWDFANNDNDPMDDNRHGTHCAGTIGAAGNDGVGVVGVNWEVSMVGLKFLTGAGSGTLANAVLAIEYATALGVDLTSNSWGGGGFSDTMAAAIEEAATADILFVAAAGNSSSDNDQSPHFPSSYEFDNVLSVAATDHNDALATFSCYGLTSVDVGAPGVDILSSVPGAAYAKLSGTSMATPHVAGIAALVKSQYPDASYLQLKDRIMNTADPISALAGKSVSGGRANAFNALENDSIPPNAVSDVSVVNAGLTSVDVQWNAAGDDGAVGVAKRYEVRIAATPIVTDADWVAATPVQAIVGAASGSSAVQATLENLAFNTEGHLAVRAADNVGNPGPVSASAPFAVKKVTVVVHNPAETMDGIVADAPWNLEAAGTDGGQTFSDSPGVNYANDANVSLALPPMSIDSAEATLVVKTKYNIESGYDFGYVEISHDAGATWTQLDRLTGVSDWTLLGYPLQGTEGVSTTFQIRFRLVADFSISRDGWLVDDVQVFAPID